MARLRNRKVVQDPLLLKKNEIHLDQIRKKFEHILGSKKPVVILEHIGQNVLHKTSIPINVNVNNISNCKKKRHKSVNNLSKQKLQNNTEDCLHYDVSINNNLSSVKIKRHDTKVSLKHNAEVNNKASLLELNATKVCLQDKILVKNNLSCAEINEDSIAKSTDYITNKAEPKESRKRLKVLLPSSDSERKKIDYINANEKTKSSSNSSLNFVWKRKHVGNIVEATATFKKRRISSEEIEPTVKPVDPNVSIAIKDKEANGSQSNEHTTTRKSPKKENSSSGNVDLIKKSLEHNSMENPICDSNCSIEPNTKRKIISSLETTVYEPINMPVRSKEETIAEYLKGVENSKYLVEAEETNISSTTLLSEKKLPIITNDSILPKNTIIISNQEKLSSNLTTCRSNIQADSNILTQLNTESFQILSCLFNGSETDVSNIKDINSTSSTDTISLTNIEFGAEKKEDKIVEKDKGISGNQSTVVPKDTNFKFDNDFNVEINNEKFAENSQSLLFSTPLGTLKREKKSIVEIAIENSGIYCDFTCTQNHNSDLRVMDGTALVESKAVSTEISDNASTVINELVQPIDQKVALKAKKRELEDTHEGNSNQHLVKKKNVLKRKRTPSEKSSEGSMNIETSTDKSNNKHWSIYREKYKNKIKLQGKTLPLRNFDSEGTTREYNFAEAMENLDKPYNTARENEMYYNKQIVKVQVPEADTAAVGVKDINREAIKASSEIDEKKQNVHQDKCKLSDASPSKVQKEQSLTINQESSKEKSVVDDDSSSYDDAIELFADWDLESEEDNATNQKQPVKEAVTIEKKEYVPTNKTFDIFIKNTISEFNKDYDSIANENATNTSKQNEQTKISKNLAARLGQKVTSPNCNDREYFSNDKDAGTSTANNSHVSRIRHFFFGYCFKILQGGPNKCQKLQCLFKHNITQLLIKFELLDPQTLLESGLCFALTNYLYFAKELCQRLIKSPKSNMNFTIKILKKLHSFDELDRKTVMVAIEKLHANNIPIKLIVHHLMSFLEETDLANLNFIIMEAQKYVKPGQYWVTLRDLLLRIQDLEPAILNFIYKECISNGNQYAKDIYQNLLLKHPKSDQYPINSLIVTFEELAKLKHQNMAEVRSITSPDSDKNCRTDANEWDKGYLMPVEDKPPQQELFGKAASYSNDCSFRLHPIENLSKPQSEISRKKFWKFYLELQSIQEGLKHRDYEHVIAILKAAKETEQTWFSRACYRILCKEIEYSQHHLNKIISLSVLTGMTFVLYKILIEVSKRILVHLVDEGLFVFAYRLLKDVDESLHIRMCVSHLEASTIITLAQIYLANNHPVKALIWLRKYNILCTNRSKWTVRSNPKDEYVRCETVKLLLRELCKVSPENALFLFEFLVNDQSNNVSPIDLTFIVNKVTSAQLLNGQTESIISTGRLIDKYNFTLNKITCRSLIATLVNLDRTLAMQLHQIAIGLGIYSSPKFEPSTYILVNIDWTDEELYLTISNLLKQLSLNIGHGIGRIRPNQLSVYINFEAIPSEEKLFHNEDYNQCLEDKLKNSIHRLQDLLDRRFDPSIKMIRKYKGRVCKLHSASVLHYLKTEHYEQ